MVASVTHTFVSAKGDGTDPTLVKPSDWNAQHVITGVALTGKQAVPVMAGAMIPDTVGGAAPGAFATASFGIMLVSLDFDNAVNESAQFMIPMPKSWNEGTVSFSPVWSHAATAGPFGVVWELSAASAGDGMTADTILGTPQTSIDTGGTSNYVYIGPESAAITISNSPTQDSVVFFRVRRQAVNGADTLPIDARLLAVKLFITTAEGSDV